MPRETVSTSMGASLHRVDPKVCVLVSALFCVCKQMHFFPHQIETCISGGFHVNVSVTRYHKLQENDLAGFLS